MILEGCAHAVFDTMWASLAVVAWSKPVLLQGKGQMFLIAELSRHACLLTKILDPAVALHWLDYSRIII